MNGSQPAGNTTTTQAPLPYMFPYLGTALNQSSAILNNGGPQYYPGSTVAGFSQPQQQAMAGVINRANSGSPLVTSGDRLIRQTLNGKFLDPSSNPYLDATFQHAAQMTQPELQSEFAAAGRDLTGALPQRSEELNNLANSIYGGAYQFERGQQNAALNQAIPFANQDYFDLAQKGQVGDAIQNQAQKLIDANKQKFDYYQNLPEQNLLTYLQNLNMIQPGSQTSQPYFTNPFGSALGGALGGAGIGGSIGGPVGGGIGAGIGGLLGLLGG